MAEQQKEGEVATSEQKYIKKIKLHNFKRFRNLSIELNNGRNVLVGDNDSGKSSVLLAVDLTLSGNRNKVENVTLDSLFNTQVIDEFLSKGKKERTFSALPNLYAELYLNDQNNEDLEGEWNSDEEESHGLILEINPRDDLKDHIEEVLDQDNPSFPFDFYSISFKTFAGNSYTGYKKYVRHLPIDNTQISNEYATRSYIKTVYESEITGIEKNQHKYAYRELKARFQEYALKDLNERIEGSNVFALKNDAKSSLETDLTISDAGVTIDNMGKGKQCFIRTEFALSKSPIAHKIDIVLLEEPENHLSHGNMNKLIDTIQHASGSQLILATHNSMLSTRLDLRKAILLSSSSDQPETLNSLSSDTAEFFMRAPNNNALEFILSDKVILVEGDAEYMLVDAFFEKIVGESLESKNVHVISVGGTSFKRYLEFTALLGIRTAVIRDNDHNYDANCVNRYSDYTSNENIKIFSDEDNDRYTFEVALYNDNVAACDDLFKEGRRTLSVLEYMLSNKSEVAFQLLDKKADKLAVPEYIKQAILWINE